MLDTQQILNELLEKRATIEGERPNIDAEFERVERKKADLEQRLSAIDIVINEFSGESAESHSNNGYEEKSEKVDVEATATDTKIETVFQLSPRTNGRKPKKNSKYRTGLKRLAREHFAELPTEFTKHNVAEIVLRGRKDLKGTINENTLRGLVHQFVESGQARVKVPAQGKIPQIYEKVI